MMRPRLTTDELVEGVLAGNRGALARAITLAESTLPADREQSSEVLERCLPHSGASIRIGITGVPGVGKSTFIEAFGLHAIEEAGARVAVLAVDPTSPVSGGSILGDKTRMPRLSAHSSAFIRPSPSSGSLGGVHQRIRECILLCEAAGFDTIIVETVGVGQSEVAVSAMTDFFLLLLLANAGDELQGIKRGIVEMCDMIAINKADGENVKAAEIARKQYESALHYLREPESGWQPRVLTCSAIEGRNIDGIWNDIQGYVEQARTSGYFGKRRSRQLVAWMRDYVELLLRERVRSVEAAMIRRVERGDVSPFRAAKELLEAAGL
jgi:LAO/AO transport system kinase